MMRIAIASCCLALGWLLTGPGAAAQSDVKPPVKALTNSIGMKLNLIPAGEFMMGAAEGDDGAGDDEKPRHKVRITRPYYIGVYEVTQGEYEKVLGVNSSFFSQTGYGKSRVKGMKTDRFPAEQVTWHKAVEFCRKLSEMPAEKQARRVYRLPTEAEWEYACRAGTTSIFHYGNSLSATQANFNGNFPFGGAPKGPFLTRTSEVGSFKPNAFGLYDMHGNVWEWCSDWFDRTYYKRSPIDDPQGPSTGSSRVIRGGEWYGDARDCRSAFRYADLPDGVFYVLGFRVVMTIGGTAPKSVAIDSQPRPQEKPIVAPHLTKPATVSDSAVSGKGEDWPRWRGPRGDGTWRGPKLAAPWPQTGLRRVWRQPIGGGYSGVVVTGGRVYTHDYQKQPAESERILCWNTADGKPLWSRSYPVKYGDLSYGNGPRVTPTIHDGQLYALGAVGHLFCLDAVTGAVLWSKELARDFQAGVPGWGFSASPVIFENLVILHVGGPDCSFLALDRLTGNEVWRSVPDGVGFATPILADSNGKQQLVGWTPSNIRGLDPRTGKLHWTIPFVVTYGTAIATPMSAEDIVFVSSYYEGSKAIQLGPDPKLAKVLWEDNRNLRGLMSQPLYRDGHGYLLDKRHGLTCFELRTGKKLWDDNNRTTPKGRNPQATLVWTGEGDRALILNADGDLILARLNPSGCREQARANIIGPTWAHPAYAGDRVYARSDQEIVCVLLKDAGVE